LVNRIELGEQVRDNLEEMLGVKVGLMSEGNMVVDNQITVASIQTIGAILKRKDQSTVALIEYLYGVSLVIADESQNIKDIGFYGILRTHLINCRFIIGLSGTPFRS
jgi:superfamily II DNA or RNA helicase